MSESNTKFPVKILVLVITIIVGFVAIYFLFKNDQEVPAVPLVEVSENTEATTEKTFEEATAKPNYDILATDFFEGVIKEISGNNLTIETSEEEKNPYLKNRDRKSVV